MQIPKPWPRFYPTMRMLFVPPASMRVTSVSPGLVWDLLARGCTGWYIPLTVQSISKRPKFIQMLLSDEASLSILSIKHILRHQYLQNQPKKNSSVLQAYTILLSRHGARWPNPWIRWCRRGSDLCLRGSVFRPYKLVWLEKYTVSVVKKLRK